jgi:phosphate transport system protein
MPVAHTDSLYESELARLRQSVLLMGAKAEELVGRGLRAFATRDDELARSSIALDKHVDQLEVAIDDLALAILARRQPVAGDLRFVAAVLKIVTDLERVGDLAVNICERVIELAREPERALDSGILRPGGVRTELLALGDGVIAMLHDALDAFVRGDVTLARDVLSRDDAIDRGFSAIFEGLVAHMMADPADVARATRLQSLGRYLERIADHATNVAEMVVFMVKGKDVRHTPAGGER